MSTKTLSKRLDKLEAAAAAPADTSAELRALVLRDFPDVCDWLELGLPEPDPCRLAKVIPHPWIFPAELKRSTGAQRLAFAVAQYEVASEMVLHRGVRILGRPEPPASEDDDEELVQFYLECLEQDEVCGVLEHNAALYVANAEATLANDFAGSIPPLVFRGSEAGSNACGLWASFWRQEDCHADCTQPTREQVYAPYVPVRYVAPGRKD